ncbi:hypothetical protein FACS189459_5420 [Bacilli bacterium]|nr:hypothetical protein FACS189459_5420 [Bacilli bacterium]
MDIIEKNLAALRQHCPFAKIYPAIKACPADETVSKLLQLNNHFDLASIGELDLIIRNGGDPSQMSYGNTIKKTKDIEYFYSKGCRLYVSDSEADVRNLAKYAPGSNVFFRVLIDSSTRTAEWPLSKKFGSDIEMAKELILLSKELGLNPIGISFHVGSQQNNPKT